MLSRLPFVIQTPGPMLAVQGHTDEPIRLMNWFYEPLPTDDEGL